MRSWIVYQSNRHMDFHWAHISLHLMQCILGVYTAHIFSQDYYGQDVCVLKQHKTCPAHWSAYITGQVGGRWSPSISNRMYQTLNVSWFSQLVLNRLVFYCFLWFYHQNFLQNRWLDFNGGVSGKQIFFFCGWPPISPMFGYTYCGPHMHFSLSETLYSTHILETQSDKSPVDKTLGGLFYAACYGISHSELRHQWEFTHTQPFISDWLALCTSDGFAIIIIIIVTLD